ncbi:hypothetical protein H4217_006468 [Coemansia sp. RSA 1939]|nr:hypothetical protein H4217_006468 [Coemansia sp. RSA 1939]KAJ2604660.1 hypothetical protein EV177_006347 [Coemansia sp. RSA 1804]
MGRFNFDTGRNGELRPRRSRLIISYIPDYFVLVVMAALWGVLSIIEPFHRDFSLTDKTIQYPHKPDSVPFYAAVLLCFVFPLVVIVIWTGFVRRSFHDMNSGVLGLCLSLVLNMMITNSVKNLAGRLRPDFISRCNIDAGTVLPTEPTIGLLTSAICNPTDKKVFNDGMRSFPSGHTSFSFAGFTYLALWLAGHLRIADRRGRAYKSFIVLVPELVAMLIGVSRTKDYRHHWQDVLAGVLLGIFMGWFGYHQYYPSPSTTTDDPTLPFPPRIPENELADQTYDMKTMRPSAANPGSANVLVAGPYGGGPVNAASGGAVPPAENPYGAPSQLQQQQQQQQQHLSAQPYGVSSGHNHQAMQSSESLAVSYRAQ